jgi:hypothetical protein
MKCRKCGNGNMQKDTWIDEPNEAEGENGIIKQPIRYCPNCMYQIEINEE